MARDLYDIKKEITSGWMNDKDVADAYGFVPGETEFSEVFSRLSVENLLFYTVAAAIWVLEKMWDVFSAEIDTVIENDVPHRPRWYRDMALRFMLNCQLVEGEDYYDTSSLSAAEIDAAKIVKYAAVTEDADQSLLTIKVAGKSTDNGHYSQISSDHISKIKIYMNEVKDVGVKLNIISPAPETFNCHINILYDPLLSADSVKIACRAAVESYILNLPYNGEYTNMALCGYLQQVEGIKVVDVIEASIGASEGSESNIIAMRYIPLAGYMQLGKIDITAEPY